MKVKKDNKFDEMGDVETIDYYPIASFSNLRTHLKAAQWGFMHVRHSLEGYCDVLKHYHAKLDELINAAKNRYDYRNDNYLLEVQEIIKEALLDAQQAETYMSNPVGLFTELGLKSNEDRFKEFVVRYWIEYVNGDKAEFNAQIIIQDFNQTLSKFDRNQSIGQDAAAEVWLFIGAFSPLKEKLEKDEPKTLEMVKNYHPSKFLDIFRRVAPIVNAEMERFIDDGLDAHNGPHGDGGNVKDNSIEIGEDLTISFGEYEDPFQQFVVIQWFAYIRGEIPDFNANEIIKKFDEIVTDKDGKQNPILQLVKAQTEMRQIIGHFENLRVGIKPSQLSEIRNLEDNNLAARREELVRVLKSLGKSVKPSASEEQVNLRRKAPYRNDEDNEGNDDDNSDDDENQDSNNYY